MKNLKIEFYIQWKYPSKVMLEKKILFQISEYWIKLSPAEN